MKCLILYIGLIISIESKAQLKESYFGSYAGGNCEMYGWYCGNWYLAKDSSFLFFSYNKKDSLIYQTGRGHWKFEDGEISIGFDNPDVEIPFNGTISYKSDNRYSSDTFYIKGNLFYEKNLLRCAPNVKWCPTGTLYFNNGSIPVLNDSFKLIRDITKAPKILNKIFISAWYERLDDGGFRYFPFFTFSPNHNYHEIDIKINEDDSTSIAFIRKDSTRLPIVQGKLKNGFWVLNTGRMGRGLIKVPELKEEMIRELRLALIKQPLYRQYLKKCLAILQDK